MLLETHTDHPRYVAYHVTNDGKYSIKTVLLMNGHSYETTVWEISDFEGLVKVNLVCRQAALRFHQIMLDKYTFIHWTT